MLSGDECNAKRRRQQLQPKKSVGLISKKKKPLCTCSTLFMYISLPLFCTTISWNFQKLPSYTFYGGNVVFVFCSLFFSLPLIFTLVAASISHILTAAMKFSCFTSNKIDLFCFLPLFLSLFSSSPVIHVNVDIKIKSKKRISFFVVFYL